jgi:hypothetical protein
MREAGWNNCADLQKMLSFLEEKWSERKSRLFLCACCRRIRRLLSSRPCGNALDVLERYAEGVASAKELMAAHRTASGAGRKARELLGSQELVAPLATYGSARRAAWATYEQTLAQRWAAEAIAQATLVKVTAESTREAAKCAQSAAVLADMVRQKAAGVLNPNPRIVHLRVFNKAHRSEELVQCDLLRDIFKPFASTAVDPAWHSWNGGTIVVLAQFIYDERAFDRLPILADALEESGCANQDVLVHCRHPGEHVRGCWAIDLILGKE